MLRGVIATSPVGVGRLSPAPKTVDAHPAPAPLAEPSAPRSGWEARLDLTFARASGRTRLMRRAHRGPLHVQRAFYPEPCGAAHVILLHPPGGLVGGDDLEISATADGGAEVLLTTPAATKFYRTSGAPARQRIRLHVGADATLEWLPQETLVFGGARAESSLRVDVALGGKFLGWELCCLGRPASGDAFESGSYRQRLEVYVDGVPACIERAHVSNSNGSVGRHARFGLAGFPVFGTLLAVTDSLDVAERVRQVLPPPTPTDLFGVTVRRNTLAVRYLGESVPRARAGFVRAWTALRAELFGRAPSVPRIWAT